MISLRSGSLGSPAVSRPAAALCAVLLIWLGGCPVAPSDGNNNGNGNGNVNNNGTQLGAAILNISSSFGVSIQDEAPLAVLYSVTGTPDSAIAYYVPVADGGTDAGVIGDRVVIDSALVVGVNQAFIFDPVIAGIGFFRVGVMATAGNETVEDESAGVIQVQGPPEPRFIQPATAITEVAAGTGVLITFDAGDPEGDVRWRVFYLAAGDVRTLPADQLGTQIETGSGNIGQITFDTADLAPGDYELGISAVDGGRSVAGAVAAGEGSRIVTIPSGVIAGPLVRITP